MTRFIVKRSDFDPAGVKKWLKKEVGKYEIEVSFPYNNKKWIERDDAVNTAGRRLRLSRAGSDVGPMGSRTARRNIWFETRSRAKAIAAARHMKTGLGFRPAVKLAQFAEGRNGLTRKRVAF